MAYTGRNVFLNSASTQVRVPGVSCPDLATPLFSRPSCVEAFFIGKNMIGIFKTTDQNTGQGIVIRFTRIDSRVRITSICDAAGMHIWGRFSSAEIQAFRADIAKLA